MTTLSSPLLADRAIRIALILWFHDVLSGLTPVQRTWLRTRLAQRTPLTARERARLRAPLLAWARTRLPGTVVSRLAAQLGEEEPPIPTAT